MEWDTMQKTDFKRKNESIENINEFIMDFLFLIHHLNPNT